MSRASSVTFRSYGDVSYPTIAVLSHGSRKIGLIVLRELRNRRTHKLQLGFNHRLSSYCSVGYSLAYIDQKGRLKRNRHARRQIDDGGIFVRSLTSQGKIRETTLEKATNDVGRRRRN